MVTCRISWDEILLLGVYFSRHVQLHERHSLDSSFLHGNHPSSAVSELRMFSNADLASITRIRPQCKPTIYDFLKSTTPLFSSRFHIAHTFILFHLFCWFSESWQYTAVVEGLVISFPRQRHLFATIYSVAMTFESLFVTRLIGRLWEKNNELSQNSW